MKIPTKEIPMALVMIIGLAVGWYAAGVKDGTNRSRSLETDLQQCVSDLSEARSETARIYGRLMTCDRGRRQCLDIAEDSQACCLDALNQSIRTLEQAQEKLR